MRALIQVGACVALCALATPSGSTAAIHGAATTAKAMPVAAHTDLPATFDGVWQPLPGTAEAAPGGGSRSFALPKGDDPIPYNAEYAKELEANHAKIEAGHLDLGGLCMTPGMPFLAATDGHIQFASSPGMIFILYEIQSQIRRIYIDGKHPADTELEPSINGHSVGHWDGQTLVIDTVGVKDFTYLSKTGGTHSDEIHSVERYSMKDKDTLVLDLIVTDPRAFTAPWHRVRTFKRDKEPVVGDFECNENPRYQMSADGQLLNVAPDK